MSDIGQFPFFCAHKASGFNARYFWFRFMGYGLHFRWVSPGYQPLFSERNGYIKVFKLGRFWIKGLRP